MIKTIKQQNFILHIFFSLILFALAAFSLTQIDLNLTLSTDAFLYGFQQIFQRIGYFNRPVATYWYFIMIVVFFGLYIFLLHKPSFLTRFSKSLKKIVIASAVVLVFSYPAFSYDIYNYMFDARIFAKYQENPYEHKALDYPQDPWTNFMRWTHRTYPYGPVWLGMTVPLSYIGFEKFIPTLLLFKSLAALAYLFSCYFIYQILQLINREKAVLGTVLFALNPLVMIESLVSAHNDIVMMALSLASLLFLFKKKFVWSLVFLLLSIGIKFATVFLIPAYISAFYDYYSSKKINTERTILLACSGMVCALIAVTIRTQFQPWYLLYLIPFLGLFANKTTIWISIIASFIALLMYIPYLYIGDWNPPVPAILNSLLTIGTVLCTIILLFPVFSKAK